MHGGAAGLGLPLDDRDPLAEVGGLGGSAFAGGTATDHHQVVAVAHSRSLEPFTVQAPRSSAAHRPTKSADR